MLHREGIRLEASGDGVTFHDVTEMTLEVVGRSGVRNGLVHVYSHHTTCCVITQEEAFDLSETGLETLQQDFVDALARVSPTQTLQGPYRHPGPKAVEFAAEHGEDFAAAHNTDAHLRSALIGRSETIPVIEGVLDLGEFGHVYFIDFDQTRPRVRTVTITVLGF